MPPSKPQRSFARRLASSGAWATIGRVASIVSVLVNYRLVCGRLGDSELSLYVVSVGTAGLGTLLAGGGLSTALLRRISPRSGKLAAVDAVNPSATWWRVASLVAVMWMATSAAMVFALRWQPEILGRSMNSVVGWIVMWIAVRSILVLVTESFHGLQRFSAAAMFGGLQEGPFVNIAVMMGLLLGGQSLNSASDVLRLHVVVTLVVSLFGAVKVLRLMRSGQQDDNSISLMLPDRWALISEGSKVLTSQLAIYGLVEFETLLIGRYCSDVQIGAWGSIRRLIGVVSAPLLLINAAIPSFVAELHASGDTRKLQTLLRSASTLATPPAVAAFVFILVFGHALLAIFDKSFQIGWSSLVLLAAANIVFVAAGSAGLTLRMTNRQGLAAASTLTLSIAYVFIAPWVIENYQLIGAATMAAIMIVIRNVIATLLVKRLLNIWCTPTLDIAEVRQWIATIRQRRRGNKTNVASDRP